MKKLFVFILVLKTRVPIAKQRLSGFAPNPGCIE
jgi:hypothetical protein